MGEGGVHPSWDAEEQECSEDTSAEYFKNPAFDGQAGMGFLIHVLLKCRGSFLSFEMKVVC